MFFVIVPTVGGCNERRVVNAIFKNYSKLVRPVLQQNQTLDVRYELRVYNIISVNEPEEIINLLLWATLRWVDPYLVWNPQDFDGCINVKVPADLIWLPDVYFVNALDIESISLTDNDMVEITDVGKVRLGLKYKVELTCPMKIGDFPFDTQNCPIVIGVWSYNYSDTILHLRYPIVGLTAHNGDPEYAPIMANASEFEIVTFTGVEVMTTVGHNAYSELRYSIGLKRRPAYYVFVILIPSYLLTSLCIIGIFTPNSNMNERNERVTLGLTTLLSMTVILNIVADQMPKGREGLALLGIFVLYEIGICTLAIILSTFIIVCHQRANARCWKPPLFCLWIGRARVLKTDRGIIQGGAHGNAQNAIRDRQPLQPPLPPPSAPNAPPTAEVAGTRRLASLLAFTDTIRSQSSRWRIGARSVLKVQSSPNAMGLTELLDATEREGTLWLVSLVERALLARFHVQQPNLVELHVLNAPTAAMAVVPPQPVPLEELLMQQVAAILHQL
uniref:Uncharacterized protein n=1 Tax=Plectus sambesii TaxID=2011161 RepID=A0A914UWC9_9BILA